MRKSVALMITLFASSTLAACQSASSCGPFVKNDLSPAGTVALIRADRAGADRVIGNDRAGARKGCWK